MKTQSIEKDGKLAKQNFLSQTPSGLDRRHPIETGKYDPPLL